MLHSRFAKGGVELRSNVGTFQQIYIRPWLTPVMAGYRLANRSKGVVKR
jgi:hypothetical protein